ncbi:MAG: 2-dehydro-3-deoxygalactonokinase [Blastocatellia bacterium]|nr:2-dehydro-3-deoxygalactonokinase [Blastocatellia bacterium]
MKDCLICVDAGTTNTRVWRMEEERIACRVEAGVGVRDTARDGSPARLHAALRELIAEARQGAERVPAAVVAAGMITSSLGLIDVPHVPAPASLEDLARSARRHSFPAITDLPVILVPGVRSGARPCDLETVHTADLMRGEETLCAGLVATGLLAPPGVVLNLGSHWKAIQIDDAGRVAGSVTSLSGELIHATQTQTILASAVPNDRPGRIDLAWLEAGMREQRHAGLARALFGVRLLEQSASGDPEQRLSFLIGAFLASDLDALLRNGAITPAHTVLLTGGGALADAWRFALEQASIPSTPLAPEQIERALLTGLRRALAMMPTA